MNVRRWLTPAVIVAALLWAWMGLDFDDVRWNAVQRGLANFANDYWPPDLSVLPAAWTRLVETIQIAILATFLGLIFSLPVALAGTRSLAPVGLVVFMRGVASAVRVPPSILWAIFMVQIFGFGPLAGVVAMTLYTVGYLAKLQYEAFEGLPRDALEAVHAMGANRFQTAWHVILPEAGNALRSQVLFMLEYNIRSSTVIGVVGAGGIGFLINQYLKFQEFRQVMTILLLIFVVVVALETASLLLRRRFLEHQPRVRWRDVIGGAR